MFLIMARADDGMIFDPAHADHMKLPFDRGWESWQVYRKRGDRDLSFEGTFKSYKEARGYIEACSRIREVTVSGYLH